MYDTDQDMYNDWCAADSTHTQSFDEWRADVLASFAALARAFGGAAKSARGDWK